MVMKLSIALLACLVGSEIMAQAEAPSLKSYSYPADGFRASFPAVPKITKSEESTKGGDPATRIYMNELQKNVYSVSVTDIAKGAETADPYVLIEAGKKGMLASLKGRLISEHKIKLSIVPGLAFEAEDGENHFMFHFYLAGSTFYQVIIGYPIGNKPTDADSFLDSFGLITRTVK